MPFDQQRNGQKINSFIPICTHMDSLIYPEDGIVEVKLEKKPSLADSIYVHQISWDGKDTVECAGYSPLLTSEQVVALLNQAFPTVKTPLVSIAETPTDHHPGKKKGPSMHSTRKGFEKPKHIR
jgi:hypothetical protein